jgi:mediator of RNA polymerase II transcription subunit 8, fungi type
MREYFSRSSLQSHSALISSNLKNVSDQLEENQELLSSMVVYPLPQFPGRTQEHILQQLLRTKLEPEVDDWVDRGQDIARAASKNSSYRLSDNDLDQLWDSAPQDATKEGMKQKWGADYTLVEIQMGVEHVKTGLIRELKIPEDDDNEETMEDAEEDEEATDEEDEDADTDKMDVIEVRRKPGGSGLQYEVSDRPPVAPPMSLENVFRFMMTGSA